MKQHLVTLFFILIVGGISSCSNSTNEVGDELVGREKAIQINYTLESSQSSSSKREEGTSRENTIDNLNVFVFDKAGTLFKRIDYNTQGIDVNGKIVRLIFSYEESELMQNKSFGIYIVANHKISTEISSVQDLEKEIIQADFNQSVPDHFVMTGQINTETIRWINDDPVFKVKESLQLIRAAAKIRLNIPHISVLEEKDGGSVQYYLDEEPQIRFINFTNTSSLLPRQNSFSELEHTDFINMLGDSEKGYYLPSDYYSYEMDWSDGRGLFDKDREPYLLLKLKLKAKDQKGEFGAGKDYYYQIPVNYRSSTAEMTEEQKSALYQLNRNQLYHVVSNIEQLGSEDVGEPYEVKSSISIEPWVENSINGDIDAAHFLMVKDRTPMMANIDYLEIDYLSSLPVQIVDEDVYFIGYDKNYNEEVVKKDSTLYKIKNETGSSKITIRSEIPKNYVPLYIKFRLKHEVSYGSNLYQDIVVTQYPPKYVTAEYSKGEVYTDGNGEGSSSQRNFNLFKITTLVPQDGERIGDPTNGTTFSGYGNKANELVSPEFIIASQRGVTYPISHGTAFDRCAVYHEHTYGERSHNQNKGSWRVPTKAEIEYIDALQDDPNSAVKKLLEGPAYMSASDRENNLYNFFTNKWISNYSNYGKGRAHTRCVFDTWKLKSHK